MHSHRFISVLLAVGLFIPSLSWADKEGRRLGRILANYVNNPELEEILAAKEVDPEFTDEEIRESLHLLEQAVGRDSLKECINAKPQAFRHLRLRRVQVHLSILGVFLTPEQIADVLRRDFTQLREDVFTPFLSSSALAKPYSPESLPALLKREKRQARIFRHFANAIAKRGYPLPPNRARKIVVAQVAAVEDLLASNGPPGPPAPGTRRALEALLLKFRAIGTPPEERTAIAAQLLEQLPELLRLRLAADFAGQLTFAEQSALHRCLSELLGYR